MYSYKENGGVGIPSEGMDYIINNQDLISLNKIKVKSELSEKRNIFCSDERKVAMILARMISEKDTCGAVFLFRGKQKDNVSCFNELKGQGRKER
jgi:hypothetical protein